MSESSLAMCHVNSISRFKFFLSLQRCATLLGNEKHVEFKQQYFTVIEYLIVLHQSIASSFDSTPNSIGSLCRADFTRRSHSGEGFLAKELVDRESVGEWERPDECSATSSTIAPATS